MPQSLFRLLLLQLVFIFIAAQTSAQSTEPARKTEPLRIVDYSGDMLAFVSQLPTIYELTFGFEIDPLEPRPSLSFRVTDATLDDLMDAIVNAKPTYRWRRDGKAIQLYPAERAHPLLDTRITSFRVNNLTATEALTQLLSTVEVQATMLNSRLSLAPPI